MNNKRCPVFESEIAIATINAIKNMLITELDIEPVDDLENNYQLRDNTIPQDQLDKLAGMLYRNVAMFLYLESCTEPELKVPCDNKV